MDALTGFLDGPRARGAFLLRSVLDPPWSLRILDRAPITVVAVVRGRAWVLPDGGLAQSLAAGDIAVVRGPAPYTVADDPATGPQMIIHPGQHCTTVDGISLVESMALGVRTWGNSATGPTVLLTGTYQHEGAVSRRLVDALPGLVVVRRTEWDSPLIALLADEVVRDDPGQEAVLDRLLDLLLVAALRVWFARPQTALPPWYLAHSDPVVGRALRLLQHNPGHPWTVAGLAAAAGASRAALARRFQNLVGEPPMSYLGRWRLALAADLLLEPGATVGAVAHRVGYASAFTFSTAFKRLYGVSPRQHRDERQEAQAGSAGVR